MNVIFCIFLCVCFWHYFNFHFFPLSGQTPIEVGILPTFVFVVQPERTSVLFLTSCPS